MYKSEILSFKSQYVIILLDRCYHVLVHIQHLYVSSQNLDKC
jgi:hypothetical protein